jgi:hypothetical protein
MSGVTGRPLGHGDLGESLLFVFPLFLVYGVGLLFSPAVNGVDFVTRLLVELVGGDRERYLAVHGVLAAGYLGLLLYLRRRGRFRLRAGIPVVLEAGIYALTLGTFILFVMERLLGGVLAVSAWAPSLDLSGLGQDMVLAAGAGVHEEMVFRLGLMGGGAWLMIRWGAAPVLAIVLAASGSSLAFSAAHHLGPYGEAWTRDAFVFRTIAGLAFAAIFWFRSFAHAVYAHFLYDVYVLALR